MGGAWGGNPMRRSLPSEKGTLERVWGVLPEIQGQILALTVLLCFNSLDRERQQRGLTRTHAWPRPPASQPFHQILSIKRRSKGGPKEFRFQGAGAALASSLGWGRSPSISVSGFKAALLEYKALDSTPHGPPRARPSTISFDSKA